MKGTAALENVHRDLIEAIDTLTCGVLVLDADVQILFGNERLLSWLGYEGNEIEGQPLEKLIPPEIDELVRKDLVAIAAGDARARITVFQRKDSTTFPVLVLPQLRQPEDMGKSYVMLLVDLGSVQTAKPASYGLGLSLRPSLERIALELQAIGLSADVPQFRRLPLTNPALAGLSDRQKEVLTQLVAGERVPAIAMALHISPHTVRNHLKSMFHKLGVGTQSELIARVRSLSPSDD